MVGAFMPEITLFMPIFTEEQSRQTQLLQMAIFLRNSMTHFKEIIETEQDLKKLETQANQSATAMQKIAATGEKLKTTGEVSISSAGQALPVTAAVTGMELLLLKRQRILKVRCPRYRRQWYHERLHVVDGQKRQYRWWRRCSKISEQLQQ